MCKDCENRTSAGSVGSSVGSQLGSLDAQRADNTGRGGVGVDHAVAEKRAAEYDHRALTAARIFQEREFKAKLADLRRFVEDNVPYVQAGEVVRFKLDEIELWGKKALEVR